MKLDPLSLHAIESFIKKNQIATQGKSKEVRLTLKEMNEVSISLAAVMIRLQSLTEYNHELITRINMLNSGNTDLDGGGFK